MATKGAGDFFIRVVWAPGRDAACLCLTFYVRSKLGSHVVEEQDGIMRRKWSFGGTTNMIEICVHIGSAGQ